MLSEKIKYFVGAVHADRTTTGFVTFQPNSGLKITLIFRSFLDLLKTVIYFNIMSFE